MPRSDLDLVFIYDHPADIEGSDGAKPIGPAVYYLRLCQRLVTAVSTETGEGKLFEIDLRLRPDGKSGPLATQFASFEKYYRLEDGDAWTWEHMALTRARTVYGETALRERIDAVLETARNQKRDADRLVREVHSMRQRVAREFPGKSPWDVKYRPGGLVDVEFIAQYLQLRSGGGERPVFSGNTKEALLGLGEAGHISQNVCDDLVNAVTLWRRLQIALRLTAAEGFDADAAPEGQRRLLVRVSGEESFASLQKRMETTAETVAGHYGKLIAEPAESATNDA